MALKRILTIGYEGASLSDFVATLQLAKVTMVLDIREIAISRRPGFAKTALREGLEDGGIAYQHEPLLGSPKSIRHQLRDDADYLRFFRDFKVYLRGQKGLLKKLGQDLSGTVALLCYERDHNLCHRRVVAEALGEVTGITPRHLGVQGHAQRQAVARSRANLGESVSTA